MHERRMAGRTGRAVARLVRVVRTHAPRVLLAVVALIAVLSQVNIAYALPWQEKDGYPLGEILMNQDIGANRGTAVYGAANEFFSTLCLIGRKSDYLQLSSEQLSELSGEGTGGAFYELSQRWSNLASDGAPVDWPLGISLAIEGQGLISDPAYIWYADYSYYESDSLYKRALADYLTIYNGGHLGSGGGSSGEIVYFDCTLTGWENSSFAVADGVALPGLYVDSLVNTINANPNLGLQLWIGYGGSANNVGKPRVTLSLQSAKCIINANYTYNYPGNGFYCFDKNFAQGGGYWSGDLKTIVEHDGKRYATIDLTMTAAKTFTVAPSNNTVMDAVRPLYCYYWGDVTGGGGGGGGTWPEPDPNPEPDLPRVPEPEPGGPGIDQPDPYNPIVEPTPEPDPITDPYVVVVAPDSTDIIEWLRAILRAINNLGDKLNAESTELQNALNKTFFNNLSKLLKNIKGEFIQDYTSWLDKELEWFNSEIHDYFVDLQNYLYRLFDWLADQMNFEFNLDTDPYDDTSLLNWLRRIYNKLGADSGPNTRPVDPSTDEDGFLDWLRRMIQNFILDLGAAASDVVSDLGDLLSRLFAKFPFSVPWDLLAILGILDAPTMVPRLTFDIPLTLGTSTFTWHVDIDMEPWSAYIEAVRTIILVSFISWLIWLTPQVLKDLDPGDFL